MRGGEGVLGWGLRELSKFRVQGLNPPCHKGADVHRLHEVQGHPHTGSRDKLVVVIVAELEGIPLQVGYASRALSSLQEKTSDSEGTPDASLPFRVALVLGCRPDFQAMKFLPAYFPNPERAFKPPKQEATNVSRSPRDPEPTSAAQSSGVWDWGASGVN